jgi:PAS domain S-box-containing protein
LDPVRPAQEEEQEAESDPTMSVSPPILAQLVRAVRHHADPLLTQLDPESPDLAPFLQALMALEQYAATPPDAMPVLPPHRASPAPPAGGTLRLADVPTAHLVANHHQIRQVLTDVPTGICILEGPEQRYTFTNPLYDRIVGRADLIGKTVRELFPELAGQGIYELLDQVYRTGVPVTRPEILIQVDRTGTGVVEDIYYALTYEPLRAADGTITGVVAYVEDVSDRRALDQERVHVLQLTQAALDAADAERQRLLTILHAAPAAICTLDGPDHRFSFSNLGYQRLVGRDDLVGTPVRAALPEVEGQGFFELLDGVYATGVPVLRNEQPVQLDRHGTGVLDAAWVNLLYAPLRDAAGQILGIFVHAVEVTELVVARQQAEAAVVLRDQFLSIAAHELRTPLTTMVGYIGLIQRRLRRMGGLDPRTDDQLTLLAAQGQRLSRLIATLTDVARIHLGRLSLERALLDLGALVQQMVEEIRVTAGERAIAVTLPPAPCPVLGDQLRLEQVVVNLVQNALKYSPEGGEVTVTVGCAPGEVWMEVQDQGLGIPADALPHLFERFYRVAHRTTAALPGMGLGLAVVHEIITLHGGTIRVESTEGVGSTFTVTLPLADAGAQAGGRG